LVLVTPPGRQGSRKRSSWKPTENCSPLKSARPPSLRPWAWCDRRSLNAVARSYWVTFIDAGYHPAPALPVLPVRPVRPALNPLDLDILHHLRSLPDEPVGVWQLINAVAANKVPRDRSESRQIKCHLLARVSPMTRNGLLRRIGRSYLTLPSEPREAHNDLTGRLNGEVYGQFSARHRAGDAQRSGGSDGFVIL
jgi:hypothetical protein